MRWARGCAARAERAVDVHQQREVLLAPGLQRGDVGRLAAALPVGDAARAAAPAPGAARMMPSTSPCRRLRSRSRSSSISGMRSAYSRTRSTCACDSFPTQSSSRSTTILRALAAPVALAAAQVIAVELPVLVGEAALDLRHLLPASGGRAAAPPAPPPCAGFPVPAPSGHRTPKRGRGATARRRSGATPPRASCEYFGSAFLRCQAMEFVDAVVELLGVVALQVDIGARPSSADRYRRSRRRSARCCSRSRAAPPPAPAGFSACATRSSPP